MLTFDTKKSVAVIERLVAVLSIHVDANHSGLKLGGLAALQGDHYTAL